MRSGGASVASTGGGGGGGGGGGLATRRPDCAVTVIVRTNRRASWGITFFMAHPFLRRDGFGRAEFYPTVGPMKSILGRVRRGLTTFGLWLFPTQSGWMEQRRCADESPQACLAYRPVGEP